MIEKAVISREEFLAEAKAAHQERIEQFNQLRAQQLDLMDEDGYPTEYAHDLIEQWPWEDQKGWFDFIHEIWAYRDWGWRVKQEPHDWKENVVVDRLHISTAGWSGNEGLIKAMEKNWMMWHFTWVQSRRGGHYIFEIKPDD